MLHELYAATHIFEVNWVSVVELVEQTGGKEFLPESILERILKRKHLDYLICEIFSLSEWLDGIVYPTNQS